MGLPVEWQGPWPQLHTPEPLFTVSTKKSAAAQAGKSRGRNWKIPCVLPGSSRPPTKGGASAEVSVTPQSCGDEIPGIIAKGMACSLRSCRLRTLRGARGLPGELKSTWRGPVLPTLLHHTPAGSPCMAPPPTSCFPEYPHLSALRAGLGPQLVTKHEPPGRPDDKNKDPSQEGCPNKKHTNLNSYEETEMN